MAYAKENSETVHFYEHHMVDALNYTHRGVFKREGVEYVFELTDGNIGGTLIAFTGDADV